MRLAKCQVETELRQFMIITWMSGHSVAQMFFCLLLNSVFISFHVVSPSQFDMDDENDLGQERGLLYFVRMT